MHACMHACIHTCIHTHTRTHTHAYTHTYKYTHTIHKQTPTPPPPILPNPTAFVNRSVNRNSKRGRAHRSTTSAARATWRCRTPALMAAVSWAITSATSSTLTRSPAWRGVRWRMCARPGRPCLGTPSCSTNYLLPRPSLALRFPHRIVAVMGK